jgi:hypothetical protein
MSENQGTNMPRLVTLKPHRYGGRTLYPGDEFNASHQGAKLLRAMGRARDVVTLPIPTTFEDMNINQLRRVAKAKGITAFRCSKAELLEKIRALT